MALLASMQHTADDTRRWTVDYSNWLDNAKIEQVNVESDSATCTVGNVTILGPEVTFFLMGGEPNERLTVSLVMSDSVGNIKRDTVKFTVVAP